MKLRIVHVDRYGYNGRDRHPSTKDEGLIVTALAMESWHYDADGEYQGETLHNGVAQFPDLVKSNADDIEMMWTAVTEDGRTLQLMGHEVEIVK